MFESAPSLSSDISFAETIERLRSSDTVMGIALFGSRADTPPYEASDYDLLILTTNLSVHIFQMHTWIGGVSADVVFVERDLVERILALKEAISGNSPEAFVIGWMERATILYEKETIGGLLSRVQHKISEREWRVFEITRSQAYDDWFWLNFDLRHIQRLARSKEMIQLMTADIRLMACFSQLCRVYFRLRGLVWKGEKTALRHLREHDSSYFDLVESFLKQTERDPKIALCEQLISRTLEPVGTLWSDYSTAIYLQPPSGHPDDVDEGLRFWNNLLGF